VYLNLTPLMDVMSNILFFLLSSFGATALAVFSISVPVQDKAPAEASSSKKETIQVSIQVKDKKWFLTCSSNENDDEKLKKYTKEFAYPDRALRLKALQKHVLEIKRQFPQTKTLILLAEKAVLYEELVSIVHVLKYHRANDGKEVALLPEVVFSSLVE
jgi:biopolymer transport protein ExbD